MFIGETTFHHAGLESALRKINERLDQFRPNGVPSRTKCIYLFHNLLQCKKYALSEHKQHIYEVRSYNASGPFPMTLVNALYQRGNSDDIIAEYWHPNYNWKVQEFLADSFIVIRELPFEHIIMCQDFADDYILYQRVFH